MSYKVLVFISLCLCDSLLVLFRPLNRAVRLSQKEKQETLIFVQTSLIRKVFETMARIAVMCVMVLVALSTVAAAGFGGGTVIPEDRNKLTSIVQSTIDPCAFLGYYYNTSSTVTVQNVFSYSIMSEAVDAGDSPALTVLVADTQNLIPDSDNLGQCDTNNGQCNFDITCQFPQTTVIYTDVYGGILDTRSSSPADGPIDFNITTEVQQIEITELTLDGPAVFQTMPHPGDKFGTTYDFWSLNIPAMNGTNDRMEVAIVLEDIETAGGSFAVSSVTANHPWIADPTKASCVMAGPGQETDDDGWVLTLNQCELSANNSRGMWYFTVAFRTPNVVNYTIRATTDIPAPAAIALNSAEQPVMQKLLAVNQVNWYEVNAAAITPNNGQQLNFTVYAVQNGKVDFDYSVGELPFVDCLGTDNALCNTDIECTLIVPECRVQATTYYIGVKATDITSNNLPLSYLISATSVSVPGVNQLGNGQFTASQTSQAAVAAYQFSSNGYAVNDETYFNIELYVTSSSTGTRTTLYLNLDERADAGVAQGACYGFERECSVSNAGGSCLIQIPPCVYSEGTWFASVQNTNEKLFYGSTTLYTLRGQLVDPITLTRGSLTDTRTIFHSCTNDNPIGCKQYVHYMVDTSLFPTGSALDIFFSEDSGGGDLFLYANQGNLAGAPCDVGQCYDYTYMWSSASNNTQYPLELLNCDNSAPTYISVNAVPNSQDGISYALAVAPKGGSVNPQVTLTKDQYIVDSVSSSNPRKNYTISRNSVGSGTLIVNAQIVSNNDAEISVMLYYTNSLFCYPTSQSQKCLNDNSAGNLNGESGPFYCNIEVSNCNLPSTDMMVIVTYQQSADDDDVQFNIGFTTTSLSVQGLTSGNTIASTVGTGAPRAYSLNIPATYQLTLVTYFDADQDVKGSVAVSTEGPYYCESSPQVTVVGSSNTKLVYVSEPCENSEEQTLYFTVSVASSDSTNRNNPLKFTLTATAQPALVNIDLNIPYQNSIFVGTQVYHQIDLSTISAGEIVYISVGNVQSSSGSDVTVDTFLAEGNVLDNCPCFEYDQKLPSVAQGGSALTLLQYCDLTPQIYTILLDAIDTADGTTSVGYVLTVVTDVPKTVPLAFKTSLINQQIGYNSYQYYSIPTSPPGSNTAVNFQLSNVDGGTLTVYYGSVAGMPPTVSCNSFPSQACAAVTEECFEEVGVCQGYPEYVSVFARQADDQDKISYDILVEANDIVTLKTLNQATPETLDVGVSDQFTFTYTPESGSLIYVDWGVNEIENGQETLDLQLTNYRCPDLTADDYVSVAGSCVSGGNCPQLVVPTCEIPSGKDQQWYVIVTARTTLEASLGYNFTINTNANINLVKTNLTANTPVTNELNPNTWVTYAFNVDSKGLVPADPVEGGSYRLSLVSNGTTTFNVDSYLNINEFADYQECSVHQYGCQGFGTACTVTYNPCCVQLGSTYYISFFNRGDDTATINAEAQVILASTMSNLGSLNNTNSVLKADNVNMLQEDLVNEHYFFVPPETVEEDGFTSLNLQVTVSTPLFPGNGQVTVQRISDSGPVGTGGGTCYNGMQIQNPNVDGSGASTYTMQLYPCLGEFLPGTWSIGIYSGQMDNITYSVEISYGTVKALGAAPNAGTQETLSYLEDLVYSLTADGDALDTLTVTIKSTNLGFFSATLQAESVPPCNGLEGVVTQNCNSGNDTCTLQVQLCEYTGTFYLSIVGLTEDPITAVDISYQVETVKPVALGVARPANETSVYNANPDDSKNVPYTYYQITLGVSNNNIGPWADSVSIAYADEPSCFERHTCQIPTGSDDTDLCVIDLYPPCETFLDEMIYIQVDGIFVGNTDVTYNITAAPVTETVLPLTLSTIWNDGLVQGGWSFYVIPVSNTQVGFGQTMTVSLETFCGAEFDVYYSVGRSILPQCGTPCPGQGAGVLCTIAGVGGCDVPISTEVYVSVVNTNQPEYGESFYRLESMVHDERVSFVTIGGAERVSSSDYFFDSTAFVFPVDGHNDFVGYTNFLLNIELTNGTGGANPTLFVSFDDPKYTCSGPTNPQFDLTCDIDLSSGERTCEVAIDSCTMLDHHQVYIRIGNVNTDGVNNTLASLQVVRLNPFINDLTSAGNNTQTGSISSVSVVGSTSTFIAQEENYRWELTSTNTSNFLVMLSLQSNGLSMYWSQDRPGTGCGQKVENNAILPSCNLNENMDEEAVGCNSPAQVCLKPGYLYVTVSRANPNSVSESTYSLTVTTTIAPTTIAIGDNPCITLHGNEKRWFNWEIAASSATAFPMVQVSSPYGNGASVTTSMRANAVASGAQCNGNSNTGSDDYSVVYPCTATAGFMSILVESTTTVSFFLSVNMQDFSNVTTVIPLPNSGTNSWSGVVGSSADAYAYYSFTYAVGSYTNFLLLANSANARMYYNWDTIPSVSCNAGSCSLSATGNAACNVTISACDYVGSTSGYLTVMLSGTGTAVAEYTLTASVVTPPTTITTITPNVIYEDSFPDAVMYSRPGVPLEGLTTPNMRNFYKFSYTQANYFAILSAAFYGVNQGVITASVMKGSATACPLDTTRVFLNQGSLTAPQVMTFPEIRQCDLTTDTYYIGVELGWQMACASVTYGMIFDVEQPFGNTTTPLALAAPVGPVMVPPSSLVVAQGDVYSITLGTPSVNTLYSLSFTSENLAKMFGYLVGTAGNCIPLTRLEAGMVLWAFDGDVPAAEETYLQSCGLAAGTYYLIIQGIPFGPNSPGGYMNASYTLEFSSVTATEITTDPTASTFTETWETTDLWTGDNDGEAFAVFVEVTQGDFVTVAMWDAVDNCPLDLPSVGGANPIARFKCYHNEECTIPFSWYTLNVDDTFMVAVSGQNNASYTIYAEDGDDLCSTEPLDFCSGVNYPYSIAANLGDPEQTAMAMDAAAEALWRRLSEGFCQPIAPGCVCTEVSPSCNSSLVAYACQMTFRACNDDGFTTTVCASACEDIQDECGLTFAQAGAPELSCNHNFYVQSSDVCDIYDFDQNGGSSSSGLAWWLWLIIGVVALLVLVAVVALIGVAVWYAMKKAKEPATYEKI